MKHHRWLKVFGSILLAIVALILSLVGWTKLEYGPRPLIPHKRVSITLPFSQQNEATNLIPMGETIEHPFPGGHPGIDFQWQHSVPLIAVADGKITSITQAQDKGAPVDYLELTTGQYVARYKELDTIQAGIHIGSVVKRGDTLAYPHCHSADGRTSC